MYQSIKLENFRAFPFLEITGLKPVNLFVGRNNAGKTSILEAIELLSSDRYPGTLLRLSASRERIYITDEHARIFDIDIRHLFTGHRLGENVWFQISAQSSEGKNRFFKCAVVSHDNSLEQQQAIHLTGSEINKTIVMPLSEEGILKDEAHRRMRHPALASTVSIFLGTEGADPRKLKSLWDTMVLTDEEEEVYKALYPIAPDLERIAFTNSDRDRYYPSDNITDAFVKLRNSTRVPLGILGALIFQS